MEHHLSFPKCRQTVCTTAETQHIFLLLNLTSLGNKEESVRNKNREIS